MYAFRLLALALAALCTVACDGKSDNGDGGTPPPPPPTGKPIELADPTIFYEDGTYYLYGTGGNVNYGFQCYTSSDLAHWHGPKGATGGYALAKNGEVWGGFGFWAPQVFRYKGDLYMAYTSEEQIAIAKASSPLGPFKSFTGKKISGPSKQIDPYVFIDDDGTPYLYHVRLIGGNKLYVAELRPDLSDIKPETARLCIEADQPWEKVWGKITEGPTILKHNGTYYFFYSANHYQSPDYAVGYATAHNPLGPWTKSPDNPIMSRANLRRNGTGHGDFFTTGEGELRYVLHTHYTPQKVDPRLTGIVKAGFVASGAGQPDRMQVTSTSVSLLLKYPEGL